MMKKYVEKEFKDGEKYIEAIPSGFPDWWRDFKEIVNNSLSLQTLFMELMDFEPYRDLPKFVNGQIVFNPLVYDFLIKNKEWIIVFRKGHLKGEKYFKKTYFKKYPNEREMNIINNLYHNDFKQTILRGDGFFNQSNLEMLGYYNGILTAYWNFENNYLRHFIENNNEVETSPTTSEKQKDIDPKTYKTLWFLSGLKFADGTMDKYWNNRQDGIIKPYSAPDIVKAEGLEVTTREYILGVFNNY